MTDTAAQPRSTGHPGYTLTLPRIPETAPEARSLARMALATWGLDADAETAELIMAELVANAVRHAHGPSLLIVVDRPANDRVYLAVCDRAPRRLPQLRTPDPDAVSGRGLVLVDELAARWGYDFMGPSTQPRSKRVWAELAVTP
ncbi:ATP-binding protein [Streptomyces sp. RLA2-12]|uniref:ATP-binding protein n=1 Tax=Streptomyces sp. RLA2-12 TaxID=2721242 RepID=UPI00145E50BB|nr:ATP-binding protein [Streptomyces sp. RLA2-12]NMI63180.1 ATP-binding protein [Streptomyces sp. RLA2-12]